MVAFLIKFFKPVDENSNYKRLYIRTLYSIEVVITTTAQILSLNQSYAGCIFILFDIISASTRYLAIAHEYPNYNADAVISTDKYLRLEYNSNTSKINIKVNAGSVNLYRIYGIYQR